MTPASFRWKHLTMWTTFGQVHPHLIELTTHFGSVLVLVRLIQPLFHLGILSIVHPPKGEGVKLWNSFHNWPHLVKLQFANCVVIFGQLFRKPVAKKTFFNKRSFLLGPFLYIHQHVSMFVLKFDERKNHAYRMVRIFCAVSSNGIYVHVCINVSYYEMLSFTPSEMQYFNQRAEFIKKTHLVCAQKDR